MMHQLPSLNQLLRQLQQVPYLASKNLYRVAHHFLEMDREKLEHFCAILLNSQASLMRCAMCYAWQEKQGTCIFCDNPKRNPQILCVVETWHDVCAIEKSGAYQGLYHILGGALCPLDGIGPENLTLEPLARRVADFSGELVLALSQNPEGEATAAYLVKMITPIFKGTISCISRGIPMGASLDSIDRVTMGKSLLERRPY